MSTQKYILTARETIEGKIHDAQSQLAQAVMSDDSSMIRHWEAYIRMAELHLKDLSGIPGDS